MNGLLVVINELGLALDRVRQENAALRSENERLTTEVAEKEKAGRDDDS